MFKWNLSKVLGMTWKLTLHFLKVTGLRRINLVLDIKQLYMNSKCSERRIILHLEEGRKL
jgi:hypothetical protein